MAYRIRCPHCQVKLVLADESVGQPKRCPQCRGIIRARVSAISVNDEADDPPAVEPTEPADSPQNDGGEIPIHQHRTEYEAARRAFFLLATIIALWQWFEPPSLWWLVSDVSAWVAGGMIVHALAMRCHVPRPVLVSTIVGLFLAWWYHSTASYEEDWIEQDGVSYRDTKRRSRVSIHRQVKVGEIGETPYVSAGGPVSESGKRHGHWSGYAMGDDGLKGIDWWYWYGEKVTEGEFHLRSNR